jgi:Flp pilus assembly protein TadD
VDAARTAYEAALRAHLYDIELLTGHLQLQLRLGDRAGARSTLDRLMALRPSDAGLTRLSTQLGEQ